MSKKERKKQQIITYITICKTIKVKIFLSTCRMYLVKACQRLEVVVLTKVQHQCEQAEHLSVEAELQEEPVVVLSYAVIDPGGRGKATL